MLSINGQDVKAGDDYWKILSTTENEYIPVKVSKSADGAGAKTFRIATSTNLTNIKYEGWRTTATRWTKQPTARLHTFTFAPWISRRSSASRRDRPLLAEEGNHRRHPEQRRRQHRSGAARHPRAAAIPPQQQKWIAHGAPAASGDRRPESDDGQLSIRFDAEVTPAGFRQLGLGRIVEPDVGASDRDRQLRPDQRRNDPHAGVACGAGSAG